MNERTKQKQAKPIKQAKQAKQAKRTKQADGAANQVGQTIKNQANSPSLKSTRPARLTQTCRAFSMTHIAYGLKRFKG